MAYGDHLTDGQRKRAFVSMLLLVPLAGAATDIYIPSLPAMSEAFHASKFAIQCTLLVFMAMYGIGQMISGPLTDTFGRRVPTLVCTCVFVLASIVIACAPPLWLVIVMRAVQGLFVAVAAVASRAIVADCYDGSARTKATNWMTIAWATGPILSPALGGYLQVWFGWTASFWFLGGWGVLVVLIALFVLPETRHHRPEAGFIRAFRIYGTMLRDSVYLPTALAMACMISVMYGFEVLGPFYIQTDLKHGPIYYGHLQLILGCLWLFGNFFNRIVSPHIKVIQIIVAASGIAFLVSIFMLYLDLSGTFGVLALILPAGVIYFLMAMIWPNGYSKCLGRFQHAGGSANALVSGLFILVSAIFSGFASIVHSSTAWPLWTLYTFVTGMTLLIFLVFLRREFDYKVR